MLPLSRLQIWIILHRMLMPTKLISWKNIISVLHFITTSSVIAMYQGPKSDIFASLIIVLILHQSWLYYFIQWRTAFSHKSVHFFNNLFLNNIVLEIDGSRFFADYNTVVQTHAQYWVLNFVKISIKNLFSKTRIIAY